MEQTIVAVVMVVGVVVIGALGVTARLAVLVWGLRREIRQRGDSVPASSASSASSSLVTVADIVSNAYEKAYRDAYASAFREARALFMPEPTDSMPSEEAPAKMRKVVHNPNDVDLTEPPWADWGDPMSTTDWTDDLVKTVTNGPRAVIVGAGELPDFAGEQLDMSDVMEGSNNG